MKQGARLQIMAICARYYVMYLYCQHQPTKVTWKIRDKHILQLGSIATYHIFLFKKNAIFNPQWFTRNYHNILPFYQLVQLDVPLEIL